MKFSQLILGIFLLLVALSACRSVPISELSQDDGISRITKHHDDGDWSEVITDVDEYKARYPYSKFNIKAELIQADAYYQSEKYPEAIAAYNDILRKHPNIQEASLVHYRIGLCYDLQAPEAENRDTTNALKAIDKYSYYIANYPNAEWITIAKERLEVLKRRMANYAVFVANFYWSQDLYAASLHRYLDIIQQWSQYTDLLPEAKTRVAECYNKLADILKDDPKSDAFSYFKGENPESLRQKAINIVQ